MPSLTLNSKLVTWILLLAAALHLVACSESEPVAVPGEPVMRSLTEAQYRNTIADVFGEHIVVAGRFDPPPREGGMLAIGAAMASVTPSAFERYDNLARSIAKQVLAPNNRETLVLCGSDAKSNFEQACAKSFLEKTGRYLFRRPLTDEELDQAVNSARSATEILGNFHSGLEQALAGFLVSPAFLYVADTVEPDPKNNEVLRLTSYSKAARLSYLLWDTTPDEYLLQAAESGELHTKKGLERQVDRMVQSPRFINGINSFFTDMLALEHFETLEKDPEIYPAFSHDAFEDAHEQILKAISDLLISQDGDYRDLFTVRKVPVSRALGSLYQVPVADPDEWTQVEFTGSEGVSGLHTLVGFTALHSHPGRSSPTLRGKAVRELLLCQKIPDPPGDIDFTLFNDPTSPIATARQRLDAHNSVPSCAGCHKLMDPIGYAIENFDGAGQFRTTENGEQIDTSGELGGVAFDGAIGLGQALHESPQLTSCLVSRVLSYATTRVPQNADKATVQYFEKRFSEESFRITELFRMIAKSKAHFAVKVQPSNVRLGMQSTEDVKGET